MGGNPHYFPLSFDLICSILWWFSGNCLPFKFGGAFSYIMANLHRPFGIVFLVTLGTMCHFSLGVG
jgi:hypothetical protein